MGSVSFEEFSILKSRRVTGKAWKKAILMVSSFSLFDVGYHSNYAQLISMLLRTLLAVELKGLSQNEEPTELRDLP